MRRPLILIVTLALVASACSGDDAGDTTTSAPDETTSTAEAEEATTTAAADTTTTAAETTTTAAAMTSGGPSCIEGDWIFASEGFVEAMKAAMTGQEFEGTEIEPTDGTYTVSFAGDGTYTGVRDEWGWSIETPDGAITVMVSGEETGAWSADDTTISVSVESSDVQVSATVEADGQSLQLPNSPVPVPEAIVESTNYECDSDTLTVTTDEATFVLDRA
jgi:hypothetical protein